METTLIGAAEFWKLCFIHVVLSFWISPLDGPIITEDELSCLPLIKVVPDGQYTGAQLNSVVRMMRGLLEQKVPLQEFEVRISFELQDIVNSFHFVWLLLTYFFLLGRTFRTWSLWMTA